MGICVIIEVVAMLGNEGEMRGRELVGENVWVSVNVDLGEARVGEQLHGML